MIFYVELLNLPGFRDYLNLLMGTYRLHYLTADCKDKSNKLCFKVPRNTTILLTEEQAGNCLIRTWPDKAPGPDGLNCTQCVQNSVKDLVHKTFSAVSE